MAEAPRGTFGLAWLSLAALLPACSSSSSPSAAPDAGDPTYFGLCPLPGPLEAELTINTDANFGYSVPVPAGTTRDLVLSVVNYGTGPATSLGDISPPMSMLSYRGGAYPGTGGTCTSSLLAGETCTLAMSLKSPADRASDLVILQYDDGLIPRTDAHLVEAVASRGAFTPAPHGPLPVLGSAGGAILAHPRLVTISFSDTPSDDAIQAFGDWVVTSSWWKEVGADYGVGAGTHVHVRLIDPSPPSISDKAFAGYVDEEVIGGVLPVAPQSVYMFFTSLATTVTTFAGANGWHASSPDGNVYAVITARCSPIPGDVVDSYTFTAGHELIEAATDPHPGSSGAYTFGYGEGEVADVCNQVVLVEGHTLPTIWSTKAAAKGGNPCVPVLGYPLVEVAADASVIHLGHTAGAQARVRLTGWSTDRVGDWLVQAAVEGEDASHVVAAFPMAATTVINNGSSLEMTLTTDGAAPPGTRLSLTLGSFAPAWNGDVASLRDQIGRPGAFGFQLVPIVVDP